MSGYTLIGSQCLRNFYYDVKVNYNSSFEAVYDSYQQLLDKEVGAVNFTKSADYSLFFPIEPSDGLF